MIDVLLGLVVVYAVYKLCAVTKEVRKGMEEACDEEGENQDSSVN